MSSEPTSPTEPTTPPAASRRTPRPLQAAALLSVLYLLARFIGLAQQAIINANLQPWENDAYTAAFVLPDYINYLVAGGAMSMTFIPLFTKLKQGEREEDAWHLFSTLASLMSIVLLALTTLTIFLAPVLVNIAAPGLNDPDRTPGTFDLTVAMTRVMLPAQLFFYLGGLIVGVLNAHKRFGATGWTGAVYNIVAIVIALLLLGPMGPIAFAWGILLGAIGGNFLLPLWASLSGPRDERLKFHFSLDWRHPSVRQFFRTALPIMIGVSFPVVDQLIVLFYASDLADGAMSHLRSGNRSMIAAQGVVAQAASIAAFPFLAAHSAAGEWTKFSEFLRTGLRRLLFLTLPLSTLLILTARPITNILFGRGIWAAPEGFFYSWHVSETSVAFAFYTIGLFAWAGQQLIARGFYAMQDTITPTVIGTGFAALFFLAGGPITRTGGVLGLAFATSIFAAIYFLCILIALESKLSRSKYAEPIQIERIAGTLLRTSAACTAMAAAGLFANFLGLRFLPPHQWGDVLRVLLTGFVACATFIAAAQAFHIAEWTWLKSKVTSRARRS